MHTTQRSPIAAVAALATAAVAAAMLAAVPAPASGAAARPDLQVTGVTASGTVEEGGRIKVTHAVVNRGKADAKASVTHFYLSTDVQRSLADRRTSTTNPRSSLLDVRLEGEQPVPAVRRGRKVVLKQYAVVVPVGTPAGRYQVLACADDRGQVKESDERDNCAAASGAVTVREAAGSDGLHMEQFADTLLWPEDEQGTVQYVKAFCDVTVAPKRLTLATALASAESHLKGLAGNDALDRVASSGQADTAVEAQLLAGTAVAAGSPGLALAALLRAHRLDPRSGSHLVNAAALAASVGLPNEAIAFLDASVGRTFLRPAMGVSQQATALAIRGHALVLTGQYAAARTAYTGAKQLAPLLREADAGLATVEACTGKDALAMRYARRARVRSDEPVPPTPPTEDPEQPEPTIDVTDGPAMPLRQLPIAETPAQGVAMTEEYLRVHQGFLAEIDANNTERNQLEQHLQDTDDARTRAEIERRQGLITMVYRAHLEGNVEAAAQAFWDQLDEVTQTYDEFWMPSTAPDPGTFAVLAKDASDLCAGRPDFSACYEAEMNRTCRPALTQAHHQWVQDIDALQEAGDHWLEVESKRMSGIAANILDEEAHRIAMLAIEAQEQEIYAVLVQWARDWTRWEKVNERLCVTPLEAEVETSPDAATADAPDCLESGRNKLSLIAKLGPTKLKINCEKVEQQLSVEVLPLLNVFVDVIYDFKTGRLTVFAGSKGAGKLGPVEAGFKSGIYLTSDSQGQITDVGWRVGPTVKATGGNAEFTVYKDEIDLSFLPEPTVHP
ncbi:tetratricopeptide (TPR) repeat protein [Nocardioides thalensis]|uniref:Tetratricopeptide (TPR) repeat protein n=1 Tax=Nocardioides thalensis TaxID=1914755 RepID=A0A853BZN5_9ACTN|nr:CARDB domain-containing protein [Nocardioides thalensis]NYJ00715.1 tetratricopeptide (TPR) repeat protein [Nocardioides thalensis]